MDGGIALQYTGKNNKPWFDANILGATGDGTTNDTTAIAAALTAAGVSGGVVLLRPGTYVHTGLTIPTHVILRGSGRESTLLKYAGTGASVAFGGSHGKIENVSVRCTGNGAGVIGLSVPEACYSNAVTDTYIYSDAKVAGQIGIKVLGGASGSYWNRFICEVDQWDTGVFFGDAQANANALIGMRIHNCNVCVDMLDCSENILAAVNMDTFASGVGLKIRGTAVYITGSFRAEGGASSQSLNIETGVSLCNLQVGDNCPTAPAVLGSQNVITMNGNVYVSAGKAADTYFWPGGCIDQNYTSNPTTGTSIETLRTLTVKSKTLEGNHKALRIRIWGTLANNANNKTLTLTLGSTTIFTKTTAGALANFMVEVTIGRITQTTQSVVAQWIGATSTGTVTTLEIDTTPGAEDLHTDLVLAAKGTTPTAAGDLTVLGWTVEKLS